MKKISVIKFGGKVIDNLSQLEVFLKTLSDSADQFILVHGGGKQIDELSRKLGIKVHMVEGRRITDAETLPVVQMTLAGLLNKNIVSKLQGFHCNAIGLSGADGNLIKARKRKIRNGVDYGWVGDIERIDNSLLIHLLNYGYTPVIASLTHDGSGNMLNTNADTVAAEIAISLSKEFEVDLVYCFDQPGVLKDSRDHESLIPEIRSGNYNSLKKSGSLSEGMIPKTDNAFRAIQRGVNRVFIMNTLQIGNYLTGKVITGTVIVR